MANSSCGSIAPRVRFSRSTAAWSRVHSVPSSSSYSAASRNVPRITDTISVAPSPLPRTSPTSSRTPYGVSRTAYRSPPIRVSRCAARYRAATSSEPARFGGSGTTARWTISATPRADATHWSRWATIRLISSARPVAVSTVRKVMISCPVSTVRPVKASSADASSAASPVYTVPRRVITGAASTGGATNSGVKVRCGGVTTLSASPVKISAAGTSRTYRSPRAGCRGVGYTHPICRARRRAASRSTGVDRW